MASDKEMNELMGRMITDDQFRKELMDDPKAAVEKAGYDLTSEQLAQLQAPEMGELVGAVDERVSKRRPVR
jgi:Ribosomally synthesized peptide prototyped by Frankia Franean1_4349.